MLQFLELNSSTHLIHRYLNLLLLTIVIFLRTHSIFRFLRVCTNVHRTAVVRRVLLCHCPPVIVAPSRVYDHSSKLNPSSTWQNKFSRSFRRYRSSSFHHTPTRSKSDQGFSHAISPAASLSSLSSPAEPHEFPEWKRDSEQSLSFFHTHTRQRSPHGRCLPVVAGAKICARDRGGCASILCMWL